MYEDITIVEWIKLRLQFINSILHNWGFPGGSDIKRLSAMQETWVRSLGWENPPEKEMAAYYCLENPMESGA